VARVPSLTVRDRIAIHELLARYAWALDTGDVEALVACFTPDAVMIEEVFEEPDRWVGHAGILCEGDSRACTVRSFAFVTECRGEPPYVLRFAGHYLDRVVKTGGTWRFRERIVRLWDGEVLARFPGHDGTRKPRRRPPQLTVKPG